MVKTPGKPDIARQTGAPVMALLDVPLAGFTVVGDTTPKLRKVNGLDSNRYSENLISAI